MFDPFVVKKFSIYNIRGSNGKILLLKKNATHTSFKFKILHIVFKLLSTAPTMLSDYTKHTEQGDTAFSLPAPKNNGGTSSPI